MAARACPACGGTRGLDPLEERRDPIGGVLYRLYRCGTCGLTFAEPRDPVDQSWYDKAAPARASELRASSPERDWRYRRFLDAGLAPGKLLDVGCGGGGLLALAVARGWKGVGVDYHESALKVARELGLDVHAGDFGPFLKGRAAKEFDAVALFDVLEHACEPRELLLGIKPVLKRGGRLVVTFPNDARPGLFPREEFDYPPHHFTRWTAGALRSLLEREGFVVERLDDVGPSALWFSEEIFSAWIAPPLVKLARRVLFGAKAEGSLSGLYAAAPSGAAPALADPGRRHRLVHFAKAACRLVTWPLGLVLSLFYRAFTRGRGEYLYALARYEG